MRTAGKAKEAVTAAAAKAGKAAGIAAALLICIALFAACEDAGGSASGAGYGVFLGIGSEDAERLEGFELVVIEPSEFGKEDVELLHSRGQRVYGYVNIGAIETYREYYRRFSDIELGVYEEWPDERWIDVSSGEWQSFIVSELGKSCADMGLDGLFLDNADVYFLYPREDIFRGLCAILRGMRGFGMTILLNGGDAFASRCMDEGTAAELFDGVNQESVFTCPDFDSGTSAPRSEEERLYFQEYLQRVKASGLSAFLLEYGADEALSKEIDDYCRRNGFLWYNAEDRALK